MGTRGSLGVVIDGTNKLAYNHYDSYPSHLGVKMLGSARSMSHELDAARSLARKLVLVDEQEVPTAEQVKTLLDNLDNPEDTRTDQDWYNVLRDAQGDLFGYLQAGFMPDGGSFPSDSLFCEYAYVIDLDTETFEAYVGFQQEPHTEGRFAESVVTEEYRTAQYYPVKLVKSWPLSDLPTDEEFLAVTEPDEDDE